MKRKSAWGQGVVLAVVLAQVAVGAEAKKPPVGYDNTPFLPGNEWRVHDIKRPHPQVVKPGDKPGAPPADAVVLFDGTDLSKWKGIEKIKKNGKVVSTRECEARWKVADGYMEVVPKTGTLTTKEGFGSCQLHIEWASPAEVKGASQGRGNSGVFLMGRYEIQILDSYDNVTYADGQAASLYGQRPPAVNVCRKPGEWQVYDIIFEAPTFKDGKVERPAYVTLFHNGVLVHNHVALLGATAHKRVAKYSPHPDELPIQLQDHGNPTRFRNIWLRPLGDGE